MFKFELRILYFPKKLDLDAPILFKYDDFC